MKRLLTIILCFCMIFALAACGKDGADGVDGKDGITPTVEISDDGYWVINGIKTEHKAVAEGGTSTTENPQGLEFYIKDDGTYAVGVGNAKYLSKIVIPSTYLGKAVTAIAYDGFNGCEFLYEIVIPDSITSIGSGAFANCPCLDSVYITDIAKWCGISFTNYSSNPLSNAKNLYLNGELVTNLVIPEGVTSIGNYAFSYCSSLASVTIPDSVTTIGDYTFSGCSSLASVTIPDSVTSIDNYAFYYCTNLTSVSIGSGVATIGSSAFESCTNLTSVTIPDSVTSIGDRAFLYCSNLANVIIGSGVTTLGGNSFFFCSITTINYRGTEAQWNAISKDDNWISGHYTVVYNYQD